MRLIHTTALVLAAALAASPVLASSGNNRIPAARSPILNTNHPSNPSAVAADISTVLTIARTADVGTPFVGLQEFNCHYIGFGPHSSATSIRCDFNRRPTAELIEAAVADIQNSKEGPEVVDAEIAEKATKKWKRWDSVTQKWGDLDYIMLGRTTADISTFRARIQTLGVGKFTNVLFIYEQK